MGESHRMKQRPRRYWLRLILFTLVMLGVGALIVIFVVIPIHAANVMSYPPRLPVCCQTPADFGLHCESEEWQLVNRLISELF